VNCTDTGASPVVAEAEKPAVGGACTGAVTARSACQYRWVALWLASTTTPLAAVTLCLVEVTSFIVGEAASRRTGVPRPAAKTGSAIAALFW
jgi:hypothetical protein